MIWLYIIIFLASCFLLIFSGKWLIAAITRVARFLGWREFVVAFFIMAFAGSIPNLFVGITSAIKKIPELSFGEVVGGNMVDLTLVLALATLFAKGIPAESRMVQASSFFTLATAILPLLLILDGNLGRIDGTILILTFIFYIYWLFSKGERFRKVYDGTPPSSIVKEFKVFLKDLGIIISGIILMLISAQGIVASATFFAENLNVPLALVGILLVGLGNCLPEAYFSIISAKKGQSWMILGDLMGAVIVPATLVLGIVALIYPIKIVDFSPFAIARIFLVISALFFLFFIRTDRKITKKEAVFLLAIYIAFLTVEILTN